jgi:hypothetical protein
MRNEYRDDRILLHRVRGHPQVERSGFDAAESHATSGFA